MRTGSDIHRPDKRASTIARRIEGDIIRRGWPIGESLGSEHTLQERYRVSRSVLREAVRLVEHHQVARMRRGPNGGLLVCEPDAAPATRALVIYLEYLGTTIGDLLRARLVLEPLAASLAAERIDEAGIDRLRAVLRAEEHRKPAPQDEFHVALAERSKNPVLQLFIDVLMRLTRSYCPAPPQAAARPASSPRSAAEQPASSPGGRYGRDSHADSTSEALEAVDRMHDDHSDIVAAVTAGDSARAKTLSERHVESVSAWLQRHHSPGRGRGRTEFNREAPRGKLAEVLAATIGDDIAVNGWQVGSVVGTETALLERYQVSRSVLREAVRLLEYHAIARMRRGPGGGLVVTKPQAQASIDTFALYLQYRKPSREDLRLVRDAIEIDNVAKVVRRREEHEVRAFLDTHRLVIDETPNDVRRAGMAEFLFHIGLAQLAGNAVLDLFLRILVELFRRHWSTSEPRLPSRGDVIDVERAHLRIIEAIAAGDDSLARYRLRRHLDVAASWWP
ncbi:MAG TPA: FCD domain-containing protein [Mycobacterium sp.]|nr:FCD domain-containing protein [Mycobacterium sp.]